MSVVVATDPAELVCLENRLAAYVLAGSSFVSFWLTHPDEARTYAGVSFLEMTLTAADANADVDDDDDDARLHLLLDTWSAEYMQARRSRLQVWTNAEGQAVVHSVYIDMRSTVAAPAAAADAVVVDVDAAMPVGAADNETFAAFLARKQAQARALGGESPSTPTSTPPTAIGHARWP
jgi:hypothetical protein